MGRSCKRYSERSVEFKMEERILQEKNKLLISIDNRCIRFKPVIINVKYFKETDFKSMNN